MLEIGSLVDGKYKILNKVGQGGMSVVYLAMNEKANKQWAVKEVRKDGIKDFEVVKQGLVAETDILKKLSHPNLPSIVDVIDTDESFIIIMDYIQGNSLNKALDEFGAQSQDNVIAWAKQLCDVLGYLHSRTPAIIYRDMKPANVMLKPDGNVTLIDFGTAREYKEKNLADTTCLGTVGYAAPEQFGGMGQTDARTDIYCLGATLYHLVTGMNPCEPPYEIKPIRQINPSLSTGLERIILKCTQRDPEDRYQSAAELMFALEHYKEDDDEFKRKQKRKLTTFIATSALTVLFAAASIWGYSAAEAQKGENYEHILLEADEVEEFYTAIKTDPTRTEAYLKLNEHLTSDYKLDKKEIECFQSLAGGLNSKNASGYNTTVKAAEELKRANPEGYNEVCFQIGWSILSYYEAGKVGNINDLERYKNAAKWFEYIRDDGTENGRTAAVFCDTAQCMDKINGIESGKIVQPQAVKEQGELLWQKLQTLNQTADEYETDYKIVIWGEINVLIDRYLLQLQKVAEPTAMSAMLTDIDKKCSELLNDADPDTKEQIGMLQKKVANTIFRLSTVK